MTVPIRPFTEPIHDLPSRSGRACRVLCPILVVLAGCATEEPRLCAAPEVHRIAHVTLPTNNESARALAMDLDGDETVDTQIGMVLGTIRYQLPEANFEIINTRLANDLEWNLAISRCDDDTVDVALLPTSNAAGIVHMTGDIAAGRFVARGTDGAMPISAVFDPLGIHPPVFLRAGVSAIEAVELPDGRWEGKIAMGLPHPEVVDPIARPMAAYLTEYERYFDEFDTNKDGMVTAEELAKSTLVQSLLAPDLEKRDKPLLSIGIGFTTR